MSAALYPSRAMTSKGVTFGILGTMAIGLGPLLLTQMHEASRISAEQIGLAMTLELVGLCIGTLLGDKILGGAHSQTRLQITIVLLAIFNGACIMVDSSLLLASRVLAGVMGGLLIWVATNAILKTKSPESVSGVYLTLQTAAQFITATVIAAVLLVRFGPNGGYLALAGLCIACLPLTVGYRSVSITVKGHSGISDLGITSWLALISVGLFMATLSSVLSYAELSMQARGFLVTATVLIVPIVLGAQIVGGTMASLSSRALPKKPVILACSAIIIVVVTASEYAPNISIVYALFALFGFAWLFVGPFHVGWLLSLDATHKTAEINPAFQLAGFAIGPLGASMTLNDNGSLSPGYSIALMSLSVIAFVASNLCSASVVSARVD